MPKVSIILSTYNRADKFLPKAIDSVIKQSFKDWELIIVDDASTDGTEEMVVTKYKDKRIKYFIMDKNSGSDTKPKNYGTKESTGEYIAYLDDDVRYRKHAIKTLVNKLDNNLDIDVVYGDMWVKPLEEAGIAKDFDAQYLMYRNFIDTSSAMMRREAIFDVGGWDESLPKFVDWNVWVRMAKYGKRFKRIRKFTFDYYLHEDTKSQRVKTEVYNHPKLGQLFTPTFDPTGCYIELDYLGKKKEPKVAIFTIHYNRPEYSKQTYKEMRETAGYKFDWFCWDNSDDDDGKTESLLVDLLTSRDVHWMNGEIGNVGITKASNKCIDAVGDNYDIIIKIDNDVEFQTRDWLVDFVDLWKRNHMIYASPYVEGLHDNPGGSQRRGLGMIGDQYIEVTDHIGGIFAFIDARAYDDFRWEDEMLHGNQDVEASQHFRDIGYMPFYYPKHRIMHRDGTEGQHERYKKYFEKRKGEKTTRG